MDRNGTLLASAGWSRVEHRGLTLDIRPGVRDVWGGLLGVWLVPDHQGGVPASASPAREPWDWDRASALEVT